MHIQFSEVSQVDSLADVLRRLKGLAVEVRKSSPEGDIVKEGVIVTADDDDEGFAYVVLSDYDFDTSEVETFILTADTIVTYL